MIYAYFTAFSTFMAAKVILMSAIFPLIAGTGTAVAVFYKRARAAQMVRFEAVALIAGKA